MTLLAYLAALWLRLQPAPCPRSSPCASGGLCVRWADSVCRARGERRPR